MEAFSFLPHLPSPLLSPLGSPEAEPGVPSSAVSSCLFPVLMATSATSPSSPLRAKDLLSESSEAPGLNQASSEVTSQLYSSLHLSRQAETTARAQLYLPSTSPPPHEVLDGLAQELSRSLSVGLENNLKKKVREVFWAPLESWDWVWFKKKKKKSCIET